MLCKFSADNATQEEGPSETTEEKPTDINSATKDHKTGLKKCHKSISLLSINGAECITIHCQR